MKWSTRTIVDVLDSPCKAVSGQAQKLSEARYNYILSILSPQSGPPASWSRRIWRRSTRADAPRPRSPKQS